jgi:hypothetical protein
MPNDFADPNFLVGLKDPLEKPAPETGTRGLGTVVTDTAASLGEGALSFARIPTQIIRQYSDDPNGNAAQIDRALGGAQEWLRKEGTSERAQAIDTNKWFPGPGERSAWNEPVATMGRQVLGLVPSIAVGAATGGGGLAGLGLFGAQGASDALAQVRDYTEQTPLAELKKLEPFNDALREFNGDERAARNKLFQDSVDVWDVAINFAANAAEFGAVMHAMTPAKKELVGFLSRNFIGRTGVGAVEGAAGGVAEGLASETTQQRSKVKMGVQPNIDVAEILSQGAETGMAMAPGVAGLHIARRGPRPTALDTDTKGVLTGQTAPTTPPPQAIQTGPPGEQFGPEREQFGPPNMYGPFGPPPGGAAPPAAGGPAGPAGPVPPPAGPTPGPTPAPAPAGAAAAPAPTPAVPPAGAAVWQQATPQVQANVPPAPAVLPTATPPAAGGPPAAPTPPVPGQQAPLTPGVTPTVFYVDPVTFDAKPLRMMNAAGGPAREIAFDPTVGKWGVRMLEGSKAGQFHPQLYFDAATEPQPGLAPVEWSPETGVVMGEPQEVQAPAVTETPLAGTEAPQVTAPAADAPLTADEQAAYDALDQPAPAPAPEGPAEAAGRALVADEPRTAQPLTPEEQAAYDALDEQGQETSDKSRRQRLRERQAARRAEAEAPKLTDEEVIERAKTEQTRRIEQAAREARERELSEQAAREGEQMATETDRPPTLGERPGTAEALEEARRRVFGQTEQRNAEREAERAKAEAEMEALRPKGIVRVLVGDIKRYRRAPTPDAYRRLRGRIMEGPADQRDRLVKMLGEQPTTEEAKARATPRKQFPFKRFRPGEAREVPARQAEGQPPPRRVERPAATNDEQRFDYALQDLQSLDIEGRTPQQFFSLKAVSDLIDQLRAVNAGRDAANRIPVPLWLHDKYRALAERERQQSMNFLAEGTPYIKAARRLRAGQSQQRLVGGREVTPDTKREARLAARGAETITGTREGRAEMEAQDQRERREQRVDRETIQSEAEERLPARQRLIRRRQRQRELLADTLMRQGKSEADAKAQAAKTIPLLRSHEEGRGRRKRVVTERLPTPAELPALVTQYVEEYQDRKASQEAGEKTRAKRYRQRERVIDYALRKIMDKHGGQADFVALLQRARGFVRDERFPEVNPATGEPDPRAWRALGDRYPETPKILLARRIGDNRPQQTIDTYRDLEAAHMKRVEEYWKAKGEQLAAVNQLQPVLNEMLKEVESLFNQANKTLRGSSIHFKMPTVKLEETITATGTPGKKLRITVGKGGAKANMYAMMVELFKANEQLKLIRAGTAASRFRQPDIMSRLEKTPEAAQEMRHYMRNMEKVADVVGLDLQSWLNPRGPDFDAMRERIKIRSDKTTESFNKTDSTSVDQEGEFVNDLDNKAVRSAYGEDVDPLDQLAIEEAALAEGQRQRAEAAAMDRARATQIDRLRALLEQAKAVNDPARVAKLHQIVAKAEAIIDKHNANRRTSPHYGWAPQSIKEVAREIADARTELDETAPDHPLISDPEPAADTMNRVKGLIADGQAQVSSFVSPEFLDKLTKALGNRVVLHTTSDVTKGNNYYQMGHDRIVLANDTDAQTYAQGAVHEAVHAVTEHLLDNDTDFRKEAETLLSRARAYAERTGMDTGSRDLFGLKDAHEFIAEAVSNEKFRQFLARVPTPGVSPIQGVRNALNGLYRVIRDAFRRVMGTQRDADTALDTLFYDQSTVLGRADKLATKSVTQLQREGRAPKLGFRTMPPLADRFIDAAKGAGPAALESIKRTRDNLQRDRGLALSVHSTYDLTTRAEPAFREKTSDVLDVASMIFRERTRMLQEDDQPILLKVNKFLNALAPARRLEFEHFLIDETMHSAYADAALFTGKNKHIHQTSLADEQVRQQHPEMQRRWRDLAGTEAEITNDAGRKERVSAATIREEAHKYFADRENEIRAVVVKHTLERSDVLPESLPPAQREQALTRLFEYIFPTGARAALDPDRLAEWRKQEREALKTDFGIDLSNRKVREQIADLRNEDALKRIDGPYFPLTRHGDYAVHGVFRIKADDATRYPEKIHWQTKRPIDDGTFLFDDLDAARDFIRKASDTYGVAQIGGGEVYIDTRTGERAMEYTPRELEVERELAEARKQPEPRNRRLTKKEIEEGIKKGKPYVLKYEVRLQNRILEYHATEGEAQASINEWKAKHPGVLDINGEPEDVRKGTGKENEQYVSQQMQRVIDRFEGSRSYRAQSDADQVALKHALTLAAAKSVMRRGVRARFSTRNYVKGASRDVIRNMADYSGSTAGYLAKMKHMTQVDTASKALRDYVEDNRNAKGHQARSRVQNELLERLHEPTQSMVESPFSRAVDRILKFTMFDKLLGLGYFAVNATEPTLIAGPLMAGKHSAAAVLREIRTAYGMFGALKFAGYGARDFWRAARNQRNYTDYQQKFLDAIRGKNDEAELLGLYNHLSKLGLFEATAGVEYQRLLMLASQGKLDQMGDYLTNIFQGANTAVENLSRFVTATAAYRLERRAGRSVEEATKYARDIVYEAHGQYANFNAPELFNRNPVFKLALQFKKYPQRMIANYIRAVSGSLGAVKALTQGKKPSAEQMMRARQFGAMLAMQGLAAGVMGMPTEPFSIPINALHIIGVLPFNWDDVEAYGRKKLADSVGPQAGELISHGVLRLLPIDVSGRLSQSGMLVYGSPGSTKVQDLQKSAFGLVAGAGGSYVAELVQAAQKGSEALRAYSDGANEVGNKRAVEAFKLAAPVRAIADIVDAVQRSSPEGMRTQAGRQMREPYSLAESIGAAAGFRPTRESEQGEARRTVQRAAQVYQRDRKEIIDHWAQSGPGERATQWQYIQQWNAARPDEQKIKREDLLRALNVRTKAEKQDPSTLGLSLDKRTKGFLDQTRGVYNY